MPNLNSDNREEVHTKMNRREKTHFKGQGLIILTILMLFIVPIMAVSAEMYEWYNTNDDSVTGVSVGNIIKSQTFTIGTVGTDVNFIITNISVKLYRVGTPGTCLFSIREVNASGYPTGPDLTTANYSCNGLTTSSPGVWINTTVNASQILDASTQYALIMRTTAGDGANYILWRVDDSSATYTGGTRYRSDDNGITWGEENAGASNDAMFEIFGDPYTRSVTLNSPVDYYNTTVSLINHNCTADAGVGGTVANISLISNLSGSFIRTNSTTGLTNQIEGVDYNLSYNVGTYDWYCEACFNDGTCSVSTDNYTISIKRIVENSASYSNPVQSTSNNTFSINITYVPSNWLSSSATMNYNGTVYTTSKTASGNNLIFNNSLVVPNALTSTNYSFYWNISLTNVTGTYYIQTGSYSQLVQPLQEINITSGSCSPGYTSAFNFTSLLEANLSKINLASISYNLQYGTLGNGTALISSGTFSDIESFNICINTTSEYYIGYGEIQYEVTGYSNRRFYIFRNARLTNVTIYNNLYSLIDADSTPFQITATNTALSPYQNYYVNLLRWYPDLNSYKIVEMGKTDDQGKTVLNVKTNEVDYRLGLYSDVGVLIKLLNPIRMVCQTTPCIYSIIVDLDEVDLTGFLNVQSNLSYNPTTKIFTYIWNDPSQDTVLMNLTVWKDIGDGDSVMICSTSSLDYSGILICDVSTQTGQLRAEVYRSASPSILIAQKLADLRNKLIDVTGGRTISLFIGLILVTAMALMGVISPPLVIILALVGLIPLIILGGISFALFIIIGAIAGIILHFLRRIT